VDEATGLLNEHFPVVLSETELDIPQPSAPRKSAPGLALTSVDPTHLSLNLRILAFTEASRTVPLEYIPHLDEADDHSSSTLPAKSAPSPKSPIYDQDDPEGKQTELLCLAQKLYLSANQLQNANARAAYLKELGNVGGLLAYKHPENSPLAKYLSQERREAVADQIDTAILCMLVISVGTVLKASF
jgi:CTLH/CRA C-terminal to LisH motif domain